MANRKKRKVTLGDIISVIWNYFISWVKSFKFGAKGIGIDLGTASILVYVTGKGIVLTEPSVVALDRNDSQKLMAVGSEAKEMLGRTPDSIVAIRPLKDGVISDYEVTQLMLKEFIRKVSGFHFLKPNLVVCIPSGITEVEERAVIDAGLQAGAKKVYLIEEPLAAAIGAGIDISKAEGNLVVDIGGGTTDVAVISLNGVVEAESIKVGGDAFNDALARYIRKKYNIHVGEQTAEKLKIDIGCVFHRSEEVIADVRGRDLVTGMPRVISITSSETVEAFEDPAERILEAIHAVLERTPPELSADIVSNGVTLTGGGSMIYGMDQLIEERTGLQARVAKDAIQCVAKGTGASLKMLSMMHDGTLNLARRQNAAKNR